MNWIDEYLKAFSNTVTTSSDVAWFPFNYYNFCPFLSDLDLQRWQQIIKIAEQKNISPKSLSRLYNGPLVPRFEIHYMMLECKAAGVSKKSEGKKVIDFLNKICKARCVEDFYGLKSAKIYKPEEVKEIVSSVPWQEISPGDTRMIGNFIMAAIHLAYAYFSDYFYAGPCFELSGPYPLSDDTKLIIRKYENFHPHEIWPQGKFPKFKTVEIYAIYDSPEIIIDQWSHIQSKINLARSLKKAAIFVDNKWISLSEVPPLIEEIARCATNTQNQWKKLNFEDIKQVMLKLRWFQFKPLLDLLDLPWEPTEKMQQRVKNIQLLTDSTPELKTVEAVKKWWSEFIDPRLNNLAKSHIRPWEKPYE